MDEYRRKRTPKKPEHPVREWVSDNLRYFMLFGGVIVIILLALLIVKLLSMGSDDGTAAVKQAEQKSEIVAESTADADKDHNISEEQKTEEKQEADKTVVVPTETPAPEKTEQEELTQEVRSSMFTELVLRYFTGLSNKDADLVESCVDSFTEEDRRQVTENTQITSYGNVEVYTCEGLDARSRIVFVKYEYTLADTGVAIPALTEFYVYDTGNNNWKLSSDMSDPELKSRIQELAETEEVKAMIEEVQNSYDEVMAAHPELKG